MSSAKDEGWPDDADGDVLRRLHQQGFDFSVPYEVEFEVDFDSKPDVSEVIRQIREVFTDVTECSNENSDLYHIVVTMKVLVTYDFVVGTQNQLSELMKPFGGRCEAWGLLH